MSSVSKFDHDKQKIVVSLRVRGAACGIEQVTAGVWQEEIGVQFMDERSIAINDCDKLIV